MSCYLPGLSPPPPPPPPQHIILWPDLSLRCCGQRHLLLLPLQVVCLMSYSPVLPIRPTQHIIHWPVSSSPFPNSELPHELLSSCRISPSRALSIGQCHHLLLPLQVVCPMSYYLPARSPHPGHYPLASVTISSFLYKWFAP